ncbi:MAG: hypothetical protein IPK79_05900 [Vampirovibrionales bacterium]|nr:hypothetical protein [Vampirovibrionales bacterium]
MDSVYSPNNQSSDAPKKPEIDGKMHELGAFPSLTRFGQLDTNQDKSLSREELTAGTSHADPGARYAAGVFLPAFDTISKLDGKEGLTFGEVRAVSMGWGIIRLDPKEEN